MEKELTRDEFRKSVFERDKYKCIICGERLFLMIKMKL